MRSPSKTPLLICLFSGIIPLALPAQTNAPTSSVDVFLGSAGGGNVFVGAILPFGMVKAGPDMGDNGSNSGWLQNGTINGFSRTHVSGMGEGAKYGNVLLQPVTGATNFGDTSSAGAQESGSPGRYSVVLKRFSTAVDIAAMSRSALSSDQQP